MGYFDEGCVSDIMMMVFGGLLLELGLFIEGYYYVLIVFGGVSNDFWLV